MASNETTRDEQSKIVPLDASEVTITSTGKPTRGTTRGHTPTEPSNDTPTSSDPTQIRAEMEETRAEMSGTIDAIQDRLTPQRLAAQARTAVRERVNPQQIAQTARTKAQELRTRAVEEYRSRAPEQVSQFGAEAQVQARRVTARVQQASRENPAAVRAVAVALGLVALLWFWSARRARRNRRVEAPATARRSYALPAYADEDVLYLREDPAETGRKARRVARSARSAARRTAEEQGLRISE